MALFLSLLSLPAFAAGSCVTSNSGSVESQQSVVSGVLKKRDEAATIKLVHAVKLATSENAILTPFVEQALKEYPGYDMATTLISKTSNDTKTACIRSGHGTYI